MSGRNSAFRQQWAITNQIYQFRNQECICLDGVIKLLMNQRKLGWVAVEILKKIMKYHLRVMKFKFSNYTTILNCFSHTISNNQL